MNTDIVKIFDTTLRDGEQSPGYSMTTEEKIRLAVQLEKLGVDIIEAGFPIASPDDFNAVQAISGKIQKAEVCGLARAIEKDITTRWEAIKDAKKPRIHTFMSTSKIHLQHQFKKTEAEALEIIVRAVKLAKSLCNNVEFSPMDAGRTDRAFLVEAVSAAIEAGATTINIADTVGYQIPSGFGEFVQYIIQNVPNANRAVFSTHCHNDLGLATANSLAGVLSGARQVECTMNGIGERAGNAALEEVVMAIKTRSDFFHLRTNINTHEIMRTSNLLKKITGQPVQPNKAIVGRNAFAHESGIHQHGFLANAETYEIMKPEDIGLDESQIVLGKHSGRAALKNHLQELGYELNDEKLTEIFHKFKDLADKKKEIEDADLDALMLGGGEQEVKYILTDVEVHAGTTLTPSARIRITDDKSKEKEVSSSGTGPVDAAYRAIEEITGKLGELTEFRMDAVTEGLDAQAIVSLTLLTPEGKRFFGRAGNTDIIVASVNAYLDAINKYHRRKGKEEERVEGM